LGQWSTSAVGKDEIVGDPCNPGGSGLQIDVRKGIGYAFVALAVAPALLGLSFALLAGGYEADAVRVAGIEFLFVAATIVSQERSSCGRVGSKPMSKALRSFLGGRRYAVGGSAGSRRRTTSRSG
jgi:hypothetical protein